MSAGWFVMDRFGRTAADAYVAGPFASRAEAEQDRRERNIADDCESLELERDPR